MCRPASRWPAFLPPPPTGERGIALLIVVSMLTVVGIMGVAFAFSMYLETQASRQFIATTRARYAAEAGVSHARVLLDEDRQGSRTDDANELWAAEPQGADIDVDGDGTAEARWWQVRDAAQQLGARYGLRVTDEAGKANLNAAWAAPPAEGPGAVNLLTVLQRAGLSDADDVAASIEGYRHGPDARPGRAGVDDDADGSIDERDEYDPMALRADDQRLESLEDLAAIGGLTADQIRKVERVATVYSWDLNVSADGQPRVNVNTATAGELFTLLLEAGVGNPWQVAVNMADFADPDMAISRVTKSSQLVLIPIQGPLGSWDTAADPEPHYRSDGPGGSPLTWVTSVPSGTFRVLAHGVSGMPVGDITIDGQARPSVEPGEYLGAFELSGSLTIEVENNEPAGTECAFRGLELVSEATEASGVAVRGIEAVRINEVMVDPSIELPVSAASFDIMGSDWGCPAGTDGCVNSGVGQARWTWTSQELQPGRYYVRVFGQEAGQTVGAVLVNGVTQLLVHGQRHPATVGVGSDGKMTLSIGKTAADGTYYLKSIQLSVQPDAEYVELINLSDQAVDVGGWTLEGELVGGRQGILPAGSVIQPHGLLVAAVDLDDQQTSLSGNGISANATWAMAGDAPAVEMGFPAGVPTADDDWLKSAVAGGGPTRLLLRNGEAVVDEVEYALPPPVAARFQSLEKGDPSLTTDQDMDGVDDGWYPSLQLQTPGAANDNNGIKELVDLQIVTHDPAEELLVLNRPIVGVGELAGLPSGKAWAPIASADLARIVDRLTVEGVRLEPGGRLIEGDQVWQERAEGGYEHSSTAQPAVAGRWQWGGLADGPYRLSLYGWPGEQVSVRWQQAGGSWTGWSPALSMDAQGRLVIGQITIGGTGTPPGTLVLDVKCASASGICHLDDVRLDPRLLRLGPVNINTAPLDVLLALPEMTDARAGRIIAGRPYGDRDQKGRGIGDLLLGEELSTDEEEKLAVFSRMADLLTTRSNVFQILSLGQSVEDERPGAVQRIMTVVQR
jgi:type II secretory pathway component PulK